MTITKAITIDCTPAGAIGGVQVSSGNAIVVSVIPGTRIDTHVQLIGLDIDGLGTGVIGVSIDRADNVLIQNCLIYGFRGASGAGVLLGGQGAHAVVESSTIRQNTNGVTVGAATASVQIENTLLDANITANLNMGGTTSGKALLNRDTLIESAAISNTGSPPAPVISTGTNFISGTGAPTSTQPLQ